VIVEFVPTTPDRFRMKPGDLRDPLETAMSQTLRLARRHPATLLFVQPAQQQIELPMIFAVRMVTHPAIRTTALVHRPFRGHRPSLLGMIDSLHDIADFTE